MSSRVITVGNLKLGGGNLIRVQSMTNTYTNDIDSTVAQILDLEAVGCEIIRVAVPDESSAVAIKAIKERIHIPLIADIHFDYKLAIASLDNGADCIRINPGNIGGVDKLKIVVDALKANKASMRIGVNSGSLEKELVKSEGVTANSLAKSAISNCHAVEDMGFDNFKVSIKSSSVPMMIDAYKIFAKVSDAPLHLGVTEAGTKFAGTIKSAIGIGVLLHDGIGDTLRVSITGDPIDEVKIGYQILSSLEIRRKGVDIISCPTCGRTEIDLIKLATDVEDRLSKVDKRIQVAVMGCVVNGPGEAKLSDYGIAGGRGVGIIFKKGEVVKKVNEDILLDEFMQVLKEDKII